MEPERINKSILRKEREEESKVRQKDKKQREMRDLAERRGSWLECDLECIDMDMDLDREEDILEGVDEEEPPNSRMVKTMDITNTASATVRYRVSATAAAAICSSYLLDLIKAGHLDESLKYLTIDKKKIQRALLNLISNSSEEAEKVLKENPVIGIFADGRKDQTLVIMKDDESGKFHKRVVQEEHITVTEEPMGTYITHFTPEEADKTAKPAYQQAKGLYEFLVDHGIDGSLLLVGGDTTNSMTGTKGGLWAHLEEMLGGRCFCLCVHCI